MAMGVPRIALSQAWSPDDASFFAAAEAFARGVVHRLVEAGWPAHVVINVNFPALPPSEIKAVEVTRQASATSQVRPCGKKRTDLRGRDYYWVGFHQERSQPPEGVDLRAIYEGPHLRHASAYRPDPHAHSARTQVRTGRRPALA